jgi:dephospho-CoA kinase
MLTVGLTGGMACGKSFVAAAFRDLGCRVIEADDLGREVMQPGGEAYKGVVAAFGAGILDSQGLIDRPKLGGIAFGDPAQLDRLNAIVHPAVRNLAQRRLQGIGDRDLHAVVIYVAAILIESGRWRDMDKIIVVTCDRAQQIERAMHRPGAVESGVQARLESQMPVDKTRAFADYVIDTSGTKEETLRQTAIVFEDLSCIESRRV